MREIPSERPVWFAQVTSNQWRSDPCNLHLIRQAAIRTELRPQSTQTVSSISPARSILLYGVPLIGLSISNRPRPDVQRFVWKTLRNLHASSQEREDFRV